MCSIRARAIAGVVLLAVLTSACGNSLARQADSASAAPAGSAAAGASTATSTSSEPTRAAAAGRTMTSPRETAAHALPSVTTQSTTPTGTAPVPSGRKPTGDQVSAVGDSVIVATQPILEAQLPGIAIDAVVGRGVDDGLAVLQADATQGLLRDHVVFELGTNSPFSVEQFDQLVQTTNGRALVVVTNHCDRCSWTVTNNAVLQQNCDAAVHCTVADWESVAQRNPQFFGSDGIHVGPAGPGAQALAELIVAALS